MDKTGKLFIVAVPIGNMEDITLRAIETLKNSDVLVCEERKQGARLLKRLGIDPPEVILLNEHTEENISDEIVSILCNGKDVAIFSDCGTPVFSDPGAQLIRKAIGAGIQVTPIPGPSSLMAAISVLDFKLERFIFGGFLPRPTEERMKELKKLKAIGLPVILMDTPYRLVRLVDEVSKTFGEDQEITLACDMTQPSETIYRGAISSVKSALKRDKAEFILVIHASSVK